MEYITHALLLNFFVAYALKQLFVCFNTALLLKYAYSEFKCHCDEQLHRDAIVVVCIHGSAYLVICEGKCGVAAYSICDFCIYTPVTYMP